MSHSLHSLARNFSSPSRLFAIVPLTILASLVGCARPPAAAIKGAAPDVIVALPVYREVMEVEDFTGRTEAFKYLEVRSRVSGELMKIHFKDGQHVPQGALLFEIDPRIYKAQRDTAKAQLEQAKAQKVKAEVLVVNARKSLAESAIAREELQTKEADRDAAIAAVASYEAALALAEQNLEWTQIIAPYAGRLSRRMVDPGNLVVAMGGAMSTTSGASSGTSSGGMSGTLLTTLVVPNPIYVGFDIDELTLERRREKIREGKIPTSSQGTLVVQVGLGHQEGYPFTAKVTFSDNQLDAGTGTLHVRAEMENPTLQMSPLSAIVGWAAFTDAEQAVERTGLRLLSPNMFVRVRLPMGQPHQALMIPEEAIGSDQGQKFVYVVNAKNEAEYRQVTLGPQDGSLRAVEKGVKEGERVVVSGQQRIKKGGTVKPRMVTQPDSAVARQSAAKG